MGGHARFLAYSPSSLSRLTLILTVAVIFYELNKGDVRNAVDQEPATPTVNTRYLAHDLLKRGESKSLGRQPFLGPLCYRTLQATHSVIVLREF